MRADPYKENPTGELYDVEDLTKKLAHDNRSDEVVESDELDAEASAEPRKYRKRTVIAVLIVGLVLGIWIDRNAIRAPEYVYGPAPTVTITEHEKEIIHDSTPTLPESCKEALALVGEMTPYLESILGSSGKISDILSQARVAITMQDHSALVDASNKNNHLSNDMAKGNNELSDMLYRYKEAMHQCSNDVK